MRITGERDTKGTGRFLAIESTTYHMRSADAAPASLRVKASSACASAENAEGAKKIEDAARSLNELGQRMKSMVERFHV